jgi:hypothetical protein
MALPTRELHRSSRGPLLNDEDQGHLVFDTDSKRLYVEHRWTHVDVRGPDVAESGIAALPGSLRHPVSGRDPQEGDDDDRDSSFGHGWFGPGWAHVAPAQA